MPNGYGLRKCLCGAFYLRREMVDLEEVDETELDHPSPVHADDLPHAKLRKPWTNTKTSTAAKSARC